MEVLDQRGEGGEYIFVETLECTGKSMECTRVIGRMAGGEWQKSYKVFFKAVETKSK